MSSSDARIGLLSTANDPLLGHVLTEFARTGAEVVALILDEKSFSARDLAIHRERTGDRMSSIATQRSIGTTRVYRVASHSSPKSAALVRQLGLDVLGNAGTPRILGDEILAAPSLGIVNCHPGILPRFRGRTCVEWAVYLDEPVGVTAHFMTSGVDEGPIIDQEQLVFARSDDYIAVRVKVYRASIALLAKSVSKVAREHLQPELLPSQGSGEFFEVIDVERMRMVVEKLARGEYAYQRD